MTLGQGASISKGILSIEKQQQQTAAHQETGYRLELLQCSASVCGKHKQHICTQGILFFCPSETFLSTSTQLLENIKNRTVVMLKETCLSALNENK